MQERAAARIDCKQSFYQTVMATMVDKLVGKAVTVTDTLKDAIERHCPELFETVSSAGYTLIPDDSVSPIVQNGVALFYFDIVREKTVNAKLH